MDTLDGTTKLCDRLPRRQPRAEPEDGQYSNQECQEYISILRTRFPTMKQDTIDPRFMHPFTAIIAGSSSSGKSMFCMRLTRNARWCIAPPPERIVYCYSVYQPSFDQFPDVEFVEGLPDLNMFDGVKPTLLIIDDLMHDNQRIGLEIIYSSIPPQERVSCLSNTELIQQQQTRQDNFSQRALHDLVQKCA